MVQSNSQVGVVAAHMSKTKGGPFDVGDPGDLHTLGYDADGNPIHSLHIQTGAYFRRNAVEDGPLDFEGTYPGAESGPHNMKVHLTWAGGVWKWYAESMIYPVPTEPVRPYPFPDPTPTNPVVPVRTTTPFVGPLPFVTTPIAPDVVGPPVLADTPAPGQAATPGTITPPGDWLDELKKRLDDWATESRYRGMLGLPLSIAPSMGGPVVQSSAQALGLGFAASLSSIAAPEVLARPQNSGSDDLRSNSVASPGQIAKVDAETPITGALCAYGAEGGDVPSGYTTDHEGYEGDPWHYTQRPANSKYRGGTASGGWFLFPPEIGPEDRESGYAPPGVTLSNTFLGVAPGARFAAGTPESANGGVSTGFSFGVDSATGNLEFYSHPNTTIEDLAVIFGNSDQNIYWYSGVEFWGMIEHANTANRTYTFPDASGTIPLGTGVANQVVYWSGTSSLVGDTDFTFDGTTLGFSGVFSGIPTAGRHFTWNDSGVDSDFRVESDDEAYCLMVEGTLNNVVLCANAEPAFNNMDGGLFLADANVVPDGNPTGGGYMYSEGGALKWRGSSGTVTTIAVP